VEVVHGRLIIINIQLLRAIVVKLREVVHRSTIRKSI